MIELIDVSKGYKEKGITKHLIRHLTFRFPRDKNVAIMGNNGAGKSTLMRLLAGSELPDSGQIIRRAKISWPLGFSGGFNGSMTGLENVRFVARIYGQDTEAVIAYVEEFAELGRSLWLPIRTYSSGMKARLAFGLSMAINFDCYLIDEITAVGDMRFKKKCQRVFSDKLAYAKVIMISHSLEQIKSSCDCGILLTANKLEYFDNTTSLIDAYEKAS